MLTHLLAPVVRFALWIYFRRIDVRGRDLIPQDGPLIYVANHPNVMLDTLLLAATIPGQRPRFLAKSTLFKNRLFAFFLRRLGAVAVSRDQDGVRSGNRDMFRQACSILEQGGTLALYPEGGSLAGRRVRPLKQGAARIALRAAISGARPPKIVPVGLTYTAPELFRGEVEVHFGAPIPVADYLETYDSNRQQAIGQLIATIHHRLTLLTWHVNAAELAQPCEDATRFYADHLARDMPADPHLSPRLRAGQVLIRAAHHCADSDPALFATLARRLDAHQRKTRRLDLFEPHPPTAPQRPLLAAILALPALYGLLHNALPYALPRLCAHPFRRSPEMIGSIKFAAGAAAFPLYYLLRAGVTSAFCGWSTALFYGLTLPASGLLGLYYKERILASVPLRHQWTLSKRRRGEFERLDGERRALLADLDDLKERYRSGGLH